MQMVIDSTRCFAAVPRSCNLTLQAFMFPATCPIASANCVQKHSSKSLSAAPIAGNRALLPHGQFIAARVFASSASARDSRYEVAYTGGSYLASLTTTSTLLDKTAVEHVFPGGLAATYYSSAELLASEAEGAAVLVETLDWSSASTVGT